jgi:hypothetical protein
MTVIDDLIEIWCLHVGWFCDPPPPPRTCGNINATDGNHEVFDCSRATNNIDDNPSQIPCDGGSCTAEMCCTTGSCHPQDHTGSLYTGSPLHERNIHQNINDDINRRYDLTGIGNDLDINNWPQLFQCKAGYKNTHAYTEQLRSDTFAINNINNPADFENHFKVNCTNNQPLNFPSGSCAECDDSLGYDRLPDFASPHKLSSSGAVDPAGYTVCEIKSCNCKQSSLPHQDPDGTVNYWPVIGTGSQGNECPKNGRTWCTSCNDGIDPILVDQTNNIQIMSCLPEHRETQRVINDRCETVELSLPSNGSIDSTLCGASHYSFVAAPITCNFNCDPGYTIDNNTQPRCEVGGLGTWTGTQATCNPNTCSVPTAGSVPNYDVSRMTCSNTSTGSIICENPATCEFPRADGSDTITYSCDADGMPLTLSGCESGCDPSDISRPLDADIPAYPPEPYVRDEGTISLPGTKCSSTGSPVGPREECDYRCPNQLLSVVQQPVCQVDGTWSPAVRPLCERVIVDQSASDNCDISSVQAPIGGSLVDSHGNQNCGADDRFTSFYAVRENGGKISDGQSCIMSCDNGSLPTDIPQCNNGVLSSQTGTCPSTIPTADYQMELSSVNQTCVDACSEVISDHGRGGTIPACAAKIDNPEAREVDGILQMAGGVGGNSTHFVQYEIETRPNTNYGTTGVETYPDNWTWFVPWTITDTQSIFNTCLSSSYLGTNGMIVDDETQAVKRCFTNIPNAISATDWSVGPSCLNAQLQGECESIINNQGMRGCNWENVSCDKLRPSDGSKECYEHCGALQPSGDLSPSSAHSQAVGQSRRICNCYTGHDDSNCHQ